MHAHTHWPLKWGPSLGREELFSQLAGLAWAAAAASRAARRAMTLHIPLCVGWKECCGRNLFFPFPCKMSSRKEEGKEPTRGAFLCSQGKPLPEKVRESGSGYTLSGKPLDITSAAARAYGFRPDTIQQYLEGNAAAEEEDVEPVSTRPLSVVYVPAIQAA